MSFSSKHGKPHRRANGGIVEDKFKEPVCSGHNRAAAHKNSWQFLQSALDLCKLDKFQNGDREMGMKFHHQLSFLL